MTQHTLHHGGCHCGAVRFTVDAPAEITAIDCNCSICHRAGYLHLMVPGGAFTLLSGADALTTYTFNTGVARHLFCRICGIKSFYVPRWRRCRRPGARLTRRDGMHRIQLRRAVRSLVHYRPADLPRATLGKPARGF